MSAETPCEHHGCGCHSAEHPPVKQPFTVGPRFVMLCFAGVALIAFIIYLFVPLRWLLGKETTLTRSLANARYIGMTLNIFAHDNAGEYPRPPLGGGEGNANLVYQQLIPFYLNNHKEWFHLNGSAWTPQPLGEIKSGPAELSPGENHYAYVAGLTRRSHPRLPLVADGFVEDQPGTYGSEPGQRGYVENGMPVVITVDNSAVLVRIDGQGRVRAATSDGLEGDYFAPADQWLTGAQKILNPAR